MDKSDLLKLVKMQEEKLEAAKKRKEAALRSKQQKGSVAPGDDGDVDLEGGGGSTTTAGRTRSEPASEDEVREFTPGGEDDLAAAKSIAGAPAGSSSGDDNGQQADVTVYGGRGARSRELGINSVSPEQAEHGLRRKRLLPFVGSGLPMQVLAGVRRPRRPRHLRGKVNPGS